jgi:hypothetical protein
MIRKKFTCSACGNEHVIKIDEDYDGDTFLTMCPIKKVGVYVVIE